MTPLCSKYYLVCYLIIFTLWIVVTFINETYSLAHVSRQVQQIVTDVLASPQWHVNKYNENHEIIQLFIPENPDQLPTQRIMDAMEPMNFENGGTDNTFVQNICRATSQVKISIPVNQNSNSIHDAERNSTTMRWKMQTLDLNGTEKTVGGDEFYITYHDESYHYNDQTVPQNSADHPLAVAHIHDLEDGSYEIDFVLSPMAMVMNINMVMTNNNTLKERLMGGNLTVYLVHTCGIGQMAPPTKNFWRNGGFVQTSYTAHVNSEHILPSIRPFEPPQRVLDLESFHRVIFVGDSLMNQFVHHKNIFFHSNVVCTGYTYMPLNSNSWREFAFKVNEDIANVKRNLKEEVKQQATNVPGNEAGSDSSSRLKLALVMGSSTWDILANNLDQGLSYPYVRQGPTWSDHRIAMKKLIEWVKENHPDVTLIWKSATPLQTHVISEEVIFGSDANATERIRYMSLSRSTDLYNYQKEICEEMNIPFLDVYDAYKLSGDWSFPSDGRHYRPELNQVIFNWFFSKPQNVFIDYSFSRLLDAYEI